MADDETESGASREILLVATDLSSGGGVNKVIRDLAQLFNQCLKSSVTVSSARSSCETIYPFSSDIQVEYHRKQSLPAYFAYLLSLRRRRPDVVIGSWTQDNILITLAFLFSRTRVVLMEHASWHFHGYFVRLLRRLVYPLAWKIVVLNPAELAHYRRFLTNVRLLPDPVGERLAFSSTQREKLIIAVGHLTPLKNFSDAIYAMAASDLEKEGWSLGIIGQGGDEGRLRQLIAELGLRRTTIHAPTSDIARWYARASLMLVTSRREVFSLVLAEAMLSGVVPIAYAADGPSFIFEEFPDHLVPIGDVDGLTQRLSHFAHHRDLDDLREKLSASIAGRFSTKLIAEQWCELLA